MLFARLRQVFPVTPNLVTDRTPNVVGCLRAYSRRFVTSALTLFLYSRRGNQNR